MKRIGTVLICWWVLLGCGCDGEGSNPVAQDSDDTDTHSSTDSDTGTPLDTESGSANDSDTSDSESADCPDSECAAGDIVYVNKNASGANNGTTWEDAFKNLQDGIAAAGCCQKGWVWVAKGTYKPGPDKEDSFLLNESVELYGGFIGTETQLGDRDWEENKTILSADTNGDDDGYYNRQDNNYHVVTVDGVARLDGFIVKGGNAGEVSGHRYGGAVMSRKGTPHIANCTFNKNVAWYGGALYLTGPTNHIENCAFNDNWAVDGWGGAIVVDNENELTVIGSEFNGNRALSGGAIRLMAKTMATISDCRFEGNEAIEIGGAIEARGYTLNLSNSTFTENAAEENGAAIFSRGSNSTIANCAFYNNNCQDEGVVTLSRDTNHIPSMQNPDNQSSLSNCVFNNTQNTQGDFIVADGASPRISSCTFGSISDGFSALKVKTKSYPQVVNSIFWGSTLSHISDTTAQVSYSNLEESCENTGSSCGEGNISADPQFTDPNQGNLSLLATSTSIDAGNYLHTQRDYLDLDLDANTEEKIPVDMEGQPRVGGTNVDMGAIEFQADLETRKCPIHVRPDGDDEMSGANWNKAVSTVNRAIAKGFVATYFGEPDTTCQIWVASGVYTPTGNNSRFESFALAPRIHLYGGFAGDETALEDRNPDTYQTALSGDIGELENAEDNSYHVVIGVNDSTVDGFIITGGNASEGQDQLNMHAYGGGLLAIDAAPRINDCSFVDNRAAKMGGGLYTMLNGTPISNCEFEGNTAENGAGAAIFSAADSGIVSPDTSVGMLLENCVFSNNEASYTVGTGGGLLLNTSNGGVISNCLFENNLANHGGGGARIGSSASNTKIENCVFWGNEGGGLELNPPYAWTDYDKGMRKAKQSPPEPDARQTFTVEQFEVINCTFFNNQSFGVLATDTGDLGASAAPHVINSIFWQNEIHIASGSYDSGYIHTASNLLDENPLFADPDNGDFHLLAQSPAIDQADPDHAPAKDFDGTNRDETPDQGAFEYEGK